MEIRRFVSGANGPVSQLSPTRLLLGENVGQPKTVGEGGGVDRRDPILSTLVPFSGPTFPPSLCPGDAGNARVMTLNWPTQWSVP